MCEPNQPNLPKTGNYFTNRRCQKVHFRAMVPAQSEWSKLKAVVIYAHGFVYHSAGNDFTVQSKNMLANNVAIFYMDHIGHGYSEGEIGRLPMYQNMIDDYEDFTALIMTGKSPMGEFEFDGIPEGYLEACRKLPYFTMGHSMGGAIVCMASRRFHGRPGYKGMILLAPALWIDLPPYCVQQFCRYTVAKWFPSTSVPLWLSNHLQFPKAWRPEWLETVAKDREPPNGLCYKYNVRWASATQLIDMAVDYQSNVGYINSPYVVMHDPDDMVTNFKGTTILMEESSTPEHEKFLVEMPGGMHNINVHMVNEVTEHAVDFIDKMLK